MLEGTQTIPIYHRTSIYPRKLKKNDTPQPGWQSSDTAEHHRQTTINTKVRISLRFGEGKFQLPSLSTYAYMCGQYKHAKQKQLYYK